MFFNKINYMIIIIITSFITAILYLLIWKLNTILKSPEKMTNVLLHIPNLVKGYVMKRPSKHPTLKNKTSDVSRIIIIKSPRIDIDYACHCKEWKWNFRMPINANEGE
jgi:hypothetical protein